MPTPEELALSERYDLLLSYRNGALTHNHGAAGGPHAASHQNGGSDKINVAGLSGVLADPQPPIIGAGATQAVAGNDARLSDARTPLAHTHDDRYYTEAEVDTKVRFPEHENVIATNYTLVGTKNAVMAGPMSTSATLTIESGATLVTI